MERAPRCAPGRIPPTGNLVFRRLPTCDHRRRATFPPKDIFDSNWSTTLETFPFRIELSGHIVQSEPEKSKEYTIQTVQKYGSCCAALQGQREDSGRISWGREGRRVKGKRSGRCVGESCAEESARVPRMGTQWYGARSNFAPRTNLIESEKFCTMWVTGVK